MKARVYHSPALKISNNGYWWRDKRISTWICQQELNKLAYVDLDKPLYICVSRDKPRHKEYLEYALKESHYYHDLVLTFRNFPGLKSRSILWILTRWLLRVGREGYIWLEQ